MNIINGNSLKIPLASESVQMVVTSPPYWNARPEYSEWETYGEYLHFVELAYRECFRVLCDGGRIAVNVPMGYGRPNTPGGYTLIGDDTTRILVELGFEMRGHVIWHKSNLASCNTGWGSWLSASNPYLQDIHEIIIIAHKGSANRGKGESTIDRDTFLTSINSVWDIMPISNHWHPAPFPPEIPRRLIELYTFKGDKVLDPFSGSGTTVKVADKLGRVGIGVEFKMNYAAMSCMDTTLDFEKFGRLKKMSQPDTPTNDLPMFSNPA